MTPSPSNIAVARITMDHPTEPTSGQRDEASLRTGGSTTQNGIPESSIGIPGLDMTIESDRLRTFDKWPLSFMSKQELAAAGFYYTNKGDLVKCPFCSVVVGRWEEGDNPVADHQKYSPHCRYLIQRNGTTNGYDECGIFVNDSHGPMTESERKAREKVLEKLEIYRSKAPAFPNYSTYEDRLRSFAEWPVALKLKPNALSEAGFFYTGAGDQTICFQCGGGLKEWEENDEPWYEHAHWFPTCYYLLCNKGREFIDEACGKKKEAIALTQEEIRTVMATFQGDIASVSSSNENTVPIRENAESSSSTPCISGSKSASCSLPATDPQAKCATCGSKDRAKPEHELSAMCKICFSEEISMMFIPCRHIVACSKCASCLTNCAVCRKPIEAIIRTFLS